MSHSKINIVSRLQRWMDNESGQTFLNYAYSWGAAIVILGTLFKLTHLPAANFFLFLGMGTEVFVFFISAFDRPFDRVSDTEDDEERAEAADAEGMSYTPEMDELSRKLGLLPDNEETRLLKETFASIHEVYKRQLARLHDQLGNIDKIAEQTHIQAVYMAEINKIHSKVLEAYHVTS